jgi:putative transferase (TIGR04331 family)
MFLITTADQRFWKTDEPVLFLGEWCKLFSQKHIWKKIPHEVLPYHWDDRKKLYEDYLYLDRVYEQLLPEMSEKLNRIHGKEHSVRYWRIVIGPWLYYFTQVLYDRYLSLMMASEHGKVTGTLIAERDVGRYLPRDFRQFDSQMEDDDGFNHYLYSRIIERTGILPFDVLGKSHHAGDPAREKPRGEVSPIKRIIKKIVSFSGRVISDRLNRVVMVSSSFAPRDLARLQLSLRQAPYLFSPDVPSPPVRFDPAMRKRLDLYPGKNRFEELLGDMIKDHMPSVYVEGYAEMELAALKAYPKNPGMILTGGAYNSNDAFKIWSAFHIDRGVKLAGVQYGGHFGTGLWSSSEKHERNIYDRYYSWGWGEGHPGIKPLPSVKLSAVKRKIRTAGKGRILMVLNAMPRYSYHMFSASTASTGNLIYFDDQYRFVRSLCPECRKLLLVRPYGQDHQWEQRERWKKELSGIECYSGRRSMLSQLSASRLFIGTYNATTFLETFAADFPTVLFWTPGQWELRPSAQPYFDGLRRVGLLHDDPVSAAHKVNEIYRDPVSWWQSAPIQCEKDKFCRRFAYTSDNWLKEWKNELEEFGSLMNNKSVKCAKMQAHFKRKVS